MEPLESRNFLKPRICDAFFSFATTLWLKENVFSDKLCSLLNYSDNYGEDTVSHLPPENRKMFLGDPKMMSSEQWEVSWKGPLCEGTDSWGFSCTFIELATGEKMYFLYYQVHLMSPPKIFNFPIFLLETMCFSWPIFRKFSISKPIIVITVQICGSGSFVLGKVHKSTVPFSSLNSAHFEVLFPRQSFTTALNKADS